MLQGTSSEALLVTVLAARNQFIEKFSIRDSPRARPLERCLVVYASDQAHSMILKASRVSQHLRIFMQYLHC